MLQVYYNSSF